MNFIINYLIIGVILTVIYDFIQKFVVNNDELHFTNWERVLLILGWPIIMIVSIIKTFKNDE